MPLSSISSAMPVLKGLFSLWNFLRRPIAPHRSEQKLEILKCWRCYSNEKDAVLIDNLFLKFSKRQAFECLSVFYRRGDIHGIVFFGGKHFTPEMAGNLLFAKALKDLKAYGFDRRVLDMAKIQVSIERGLFRVTDCWYLSSLGISNYPPRSKNPALISPKIFGSTKKIPAYGIEHHPPKDDEEGIFEALFGNSFDGDLEEHLNGKTDEISLPTDQKIANLIDVEAISLEVIKRIKQGSEIEIEQRFCDELQSGWVPDLESQIRENTKKWRRELECYETPGWSFLKDSKDQRTLSNTPKNVT